MLSQLLEKLPSVGVIVACQIDPLISWRESNIVCPKLSDIVMMDINTLPKPLHDKVSGMLDCEQKW